MMSLIDRKQAMECLKKEYNRRFMQGDRDGLKLAWIEKAVDDAPEVDAEPVRHGKWIYGNDFHWYTASCSACGYQRRTDIKATGWNQWKYCPNCGAKMDKERREE